MKIYALIKDNKVVYIGATNKKYLSDRITDHRYLNKVFDTYKLIELTDDPTREKYWINYYDTFDNGLNLTEDGLGKINGSTATWDRRPIKIFNNEGFEMTYKSISEASMDLCLDPSNLSKVATGKRKQHKGYKAKYLS